MMERKGWNASQTIHAARNFLEESAKLTNAHMSLYVNGRAVPKPRYLRAISQALEVSEAELLGPDANDELVRDEGALTKTGDVIHPPGTVRVSDADGANALLEISQRVPWTTALEILRLLKAHEETEHE